MTLDAHHHLWDPIARRHAWLDEAPPVLRRRFDLADFEAASSPCGVTSSVLVQTLASRQESEELLALAASSPLVAGVVGWVDLTASDVAGALEELAQLGAGALVGVRHLVQDEPDPQWLTRPEVLRGLRAVAGAGLACDLLVRPAQLAAATSAVDAVEGGRYVLDHGAKPPIASGALDPWAGLVAELARRPQVTCKLSGLVTEAGPCFTPADFAPYVDHLLEVFGPHRLLYGSDWPVCLAAASYAEVFGLATSLLSERAGKAETAAILSGNAVATYALGAVRG